MPKQKGDCLTQAEYDTIRDLHNMGYSQSQIAKAVDRSTSAICYVLKHAPTIRRTDAGRPSRYEYMEMEEIDYAVLPDNALFDFKDFLIY